MKKETHPEIYDVIFRDISANVDFCTKSTMKSEVTEEKNGKTFYVIETEVSSASHPFYTGEERVLDTAGRVEKFKSRAEKKGN